MILFSLINEVIGIKTLNHRGNCRFLTCSLDQASQLPDMQNVAVNWDSRQEYQLGQ